MIPRVNINEEERIRKFSVAFNHEMIDNSREAIERLFEASLFALNSQQDLLSTQYALLNQLLVLENARKKFRRYKSLVQWAVGTLRQQKAHQTRLSRGEDLEWGFDSGELACGLLISVLKTIGDGLAWRVLNYDQPLLRLMSEHSPVSVPQPNKGLVEELRQLGKLLATSETPVVLNAITNCLRIGDLTAVESTTGGVTLHEVKSGTRVTARTRRQAEYLRIVQEGIDQENLPMAGQSIVKLTANRPLKTYMSSLAGALTESDAKLCSSRKFGDHLAFGVIAQRKLFREVAEADRAGIRKPIFERMESLKSSSEDLLTDPTSHQHSIIGFSPNVAPYSVFPLENKHRLGLMYGDYMVLSTINVHGLARWLRKRGWNITVLDLDKQTFEEESLHLPVMRVHRKEWSFEVGWTLILTAAAELWMPESFELLFGTMFGGLPGKNAVQSYSESPVMVTFRNEGRWAWN